MNTIFNSCLIRDPAGKGSQCFENRNKVAYHLASSKRHYSALCEKTATFKYDGGWESKDKENNLKCRILIVRK